MHKEYIENKVKKYYWEDDINCATTVLKILSEYYDIKLNKQVIDSVIGMHGAGEYGAQCGLVEGTLLFIGLYGKSKNMNEKKIIFYCNQFAKTYEDEFKSLLCSVLRPEGFKKTNPAHLCESLTCKSTQLSIDFIDNMNKNELKF
jgi:C_GCAxxG_C_C family probable redox protein